MSSEALGVVVAVVVVVGAAAGFRACLWGGAPPLRRRVTCFGNVFKKQIF
jgi:hypothetical protein